MLWSVGIVAPLLTRMHITVEIFVSSTRVLSRPHPITQLR